MALQTRSGAIRLTRWIAMRCELRVARFFFVISSRKFLSVTPRTTFLRGKTSSPKVGSRRFSSQPVP